jgi:spermidine synthase
LGWDAETASLLLAKNAVGSLLILGLGGGTVARQCRTLFPDAVIVGVELDQRVIDLAYQRFALRSTGLKVIAMAGENYLRKTNRTFDAILDDMWLPHHPDQRAVLTDPEWSKLVFSRITPRGMYAVNLYSRSESRNQASGAVNRLRSTFPTLCEVRPGPGETTVIAGGRNLCTPRETRAKLRSLPPSLAAALAHVSFRTIL